MVACGSLARTPEPPQAGWEPIAYSYGSARPHAVTAAGANTYEYDANGNTLAPGASAGVTCRVEAGVTYVQSYNAENRLSVVKKLLEGTCAAPVKFDRQWDLSYDGDGTRAGTVLTSFDPDTQAITGTSVTSYFMAGLYEETDGVARKYYAIAGMTVAMSDTEGMKYLLTDHLGSVAAITDDEGTLLDQQRYLPFGAERPNVGSITQTDFGYTGQRDLPSMGLMDYKARFYDSSIGRFIQPDSIIPDPADPQGWNRYSYVRANPLRFVDPTGHYIVEEEDCTKLRCSGDPDDQARREQMKRWQRRDDVAGVFGGISLGLDFAGWLVSFGEAAVSDFFIGAGVFVSSVHPAAAISLPELFAMDLFLAGPSNPIGLAENILGGASAASTIIADLVRGDTSFGPGGLQTVGKDSVVSLRNAALGHFPRAIGTSR